MDLERITIFCFAASYVVALGVEVVHLLQPRRLLRGLSLLFGGAGLFAHTVYVLTQFLPLASPHGSLLVLALVLAVFYFYGAIHHSRIAWGLFVLPLVIGLIVLAMAVSPQATPRDGDGAFQFLTANQGRTFWGMMHVALLLLAAVGICVAFIASVMYVVQVRRLRAKLAPGQGVPLLSLERIEDMNRRAILLAFPLLTAGLLVGVVLQLQTGSFFEGWTSPKILSAVGLWLVFAILLYLRYGAHARGRQVALLTMLAFALMVFALVSPVHPFVE
jgi:ABC-type transport system involved in cytochrome c biogenesis permease subunit